MRDGDLDLERVASVLALHNVNYVLVGGLAVFLQGGESPTLDIDLAIDRAESNMVNLADALAELAARPQRWAGGKYIFQVADLASGWLHLESEAGDIDLIARTPGMDFEELASTASQVSLGKCTVSVASVASLIVMKSNTGRARDSRHVEELKRIQDWREQHP